MFSWIKGLVESLGYWGLALLTLLENVFPPIPSEVILPLGGFLTVRGDLHIIGVIVAGTIGSLVGATFWYWIGRAIGERRLRGWVERHGVWLAMSPDDLDRAEQWFRRHGGKAVLIGRLIPTMRSVISIPAGLTGMHLAPFLLYSAIGTAVWTTILAYAGRLLGSQYDKSRPTWTRSPGRSSGVRCCSTSTASFS